MSRRLLPPDSIRRLAGFGGVCSVDSYVLRPEDEEGVRQALALARESGRTLALRGAGRSYGDAAIEPEGIVLDLTALNRIVSWDPESGLLDAEAGTTFGDVWRRTLPDGWWPPVVPGTMAPTLGGALAMNVHGKNCLREGTLGEHVEAIEVLPTDGGQRIVLRPSDPRFAGVVSGAGLSGVITAVRLKLKRVPSGDVLVRALSCPGWAEQFAAFERCEPESDYMVSWVDCFARGKARGRGLFHAASYAEGPAATYLEAHQSLPERILGLVPKSEAWRALRLLNNRIGMRAVNAAKFLAGRVLEHGREARQSLVEFSFLLDFVPGWQRAYGSGGFIQYQSFVPTRDAWSVFDAQLEMQQAAGMESFLGVLKRHRTDGFAFSHGVDGYSLALDFKVTSASRDRLWELASRMNELVLAAGGRFYLAKDSTLAADEFGASIGETGLRLWREARESLDPAGLLATAQGRRLGLVP